MSFHQRCASCWGRVWLPLLTAMILTNILLVFTSWKWWLSFTPKYDVQSNTNDKGDDNAVALHLIAYAHVPAAIVPPHFLCFTLDTQNGTLHANTSVVQNALDLNNTRLRTLTKALAPAHLRIGGGSFDYLVYIVPPGPSDDSDDASMKNQNLCTPELAQAGLCLIMERWVEMVQFATDTGFRMSFDLNIMRGRQPQLPDKSNSSLASSSSWDPSNIRQFLAWTAQRWPRNEFLHMFELGNEQQHKMDPVEAAQSHETVRAMIDEFWPHHDAPRLIGPAANFRPDWFARFAQVLSPGTLHALTYHLYPGYGPSTDLERLLISPAWLDLSHSIMEKMARPAIRQQGQPHVWISESAAAWDSGAAGITNGFLSSFWYLDTLGHAATTGHGVFCKSTLLGGNYSILDPTQHHVPNPAYWIALLFRRLVMARKEQEETIMLDVMQFTPGTIDYDPAVRSYLSCTPPPYPKGAMTLIWINTAASSWKTIRLQKDIKGDANHDDEAYGLPRWDYIMTAGPPSKDPTDVCSHNNALCSRQIRLNGKVLQLQQSNDDDNLLPPLHGAAATNPLLMLPPLSVGFSVYSHAAAPACMAAARDKKDGLSESPWAAFGSEF